MMKHSLLPSLLATVCAMVLSPDLKGAVLITPTAISYVGTGVEFFPTEANLINGTGLSGAANIGNYTTITHASVTTNNAWVTDDPAPAAGDYFADSGGATVIFTTTLDQSYNLTDFVFWGYHFNAANGNEARQFQIEFSTNNGSSYGASVIVANPLSTYAQGAASTLSLGGTFAANALRVTVLDNHFGGTAAGGDRVGIGEIRFVGDVIPEPSVALLGGLGLLAVMRRRR